MKPVKFIKTLMLIVFMTIGLTACYEQIPAGHQGKVMGNSGFQPEVYPPSKVWLSSFLPVETIYLVQTTTQRDSQKISVLLSDKLQLTAEISFRGRIRGEAANINTIFNDMKMDDDVVTYNEVYETYGQMIVENTARSVISKYNVDEVNTNLELITTELYNALVPKFEHLPLELSDITLGNIQYPEIVTQAINTAKQRRMEIEETQANAQKKLAKAKGDEEVAKATYRIKMLEAKRIRDYNAMVAEGITQDLLTLRQLELREKELEKWNGVLPTTLMGGNVPVIVNSK